MADRLRSPSEFNEAPHSGIFDRPITRIFVVVTRRIQAPEFFNKALVVGPA